MVRTASTYSHPPPGPCGLQLPRVAESSTRERPDRKSILESFRDSLGIASLEKSPGMQELVPLRLAELRMLLKGFPKLS